MKQELIKELIKLRSIEPNRAFVKKCRLLILEKTAQKPVIVLWPRIVWIGALAGLLLIITLPNLISRKQLNTASLNNVEKLSREFNEMAINIQLKEISYQQNINQAIASALTEISDTQIKHLNQSILEKEDNGFDVSNNQNQEINDLLNKVIF